MTVIFLKTQTHIDGVPIMWYGIMSIQVHCVIGYIYNVFVIPGSSGSYVDSYVHDKNVCS